MKSTKRKPTRPSAAATENVGFPILLKHAAIGSGIALLCALLFLLLGAALCFLSKDPNALVIPIGLGALYLSSCIGGALATRLNRGAPLLCGLISGGLLTVFFWFLTVFFSGSETSHLFSFPLSLALRVLIIGFAILGAWLGVKQGKPRRRR